MPETDGDTSANTARFQAFATRGDDDLPAPWRMRAQGSKIGILIAVVVVAVIFAIIIGIALGA
jgi:hypothetical protein